MAMKVQFNVIVERISNGDNEELLVAFDGLTGIGAERPLDINELVAVVRSLEEILRGYPATIREYSTGEIGEA